MEWERLNDRYLKNHPFTGDNISAYSLLHAHEHGITLMNIPLFNSFLYQRNLFIFANFTYGPLHLTRTKNHLKLSWTLLYLILGPYAAYALTCNYYWRKFQIDFEISAICVGGCFTLTVFLVIVIMGNVGGYYSIVHSISWNLDGYIPYLSVLTPYFRPWLFTRCCEWLDNLAMKIALSQSDTIEWLICWSSHPGLDFYLIFRDEWNVGWAYLLALNNIGYMYV